MERLNKLSYEIIGCAMKVHSQLGPGLLESTYEACLEYELLQKGFKVARQKYLPVIYNSIKLDAGYRIDLMVEDEIIIELKAVRETTPIDEAQLMTYLKLSGKKLGLLINFNVKVLKDGITRRIM
ncbi:MAG: GxxExxY protein [Bacteroidetes bacterium]|nr:MAG: GxxExxY protein [Bacteroidota bacterium]